MQTNILVWRELSVFLIYILKTPGPWYHNPVQCCGRNCSLKYSEVQLLHIYCCFGIVTVHINTLVGLWVSFVLNLHFTSNSSYSSFSYPNKTNPFLNPPYPLLLPRWVLFKLQQPRNYTGTTKKADNYLQYLSDTWQQQHPTGSSSTRPTHQHTTHNHTLKKRN